MGQGSESLGGDSYDFYEFDYDDYDDYLYLKISQNKSSCKPKINSFKSVGEKKPIRGAKVDKKCSFCGASHTVRRADLDRGWGLFCSKSCKAKEQEKRTGQNREYILRNS